MEEFEALRFMPVDALEPGQVAAINAIRQALGDVADGTPVTRVIGLDGQFGGLDMLNSGNPNLAGFFARSDDAAGAVTTPQWIERLRLDGSLQGGSPHALIETRANAAIVAQTRIPKSTGFSTGHPREEVLTNHQYPFTGNGLTASRDGRIVPEFRTAGGNPVAMSAGNGPGGEPLTVMRFRNPDGTARLVPGPGGALASDWKLVPDASSPTGFRWEALP